MIFHLANNYRQAKDYSDRKRLEWVAGSIAFGVGISASFLAAGSRLAAVSNLAVLPVPFCFWCAIAKHKFLDLRVVIRAGIQYLLAVQLLRVLTLGPIALMAWYWWRDPVASISSPVNIASFGILAFAGLGLEFRQKVLARLDRHFFREQLDREQMLRALALELAHKGSWDDIVHALHLSQPSFSTLPDAAPTDVEAVSFPSRDPQGKTQAWLVLGPRRSEEPYAVPEPESLELIATHLGLVRENLLQAEARFDAVLGERARIARELHETMSQGFAGISLYLQAAQKIMEAAPDEARSYLDEARSLATQSIHEVGTSVRNLGDPHDNHNLGSRLRALAARTPSGSQSGAPHITIDLDEDAAATAPPEVALHLTRIAVEALTNALKYAEATEILIRLQFFKRAHLQDGLELTVTDNGREFDVEVSGKHGFGLTGMRERIQQLRGTLFINAKPGLGATITATVPLSTQTP